MILECACGKMYRVRDDAANQPSKCPVCGGALRPAGPPTAGGSPDPRLKDTELRLRTVERERDEARDRAGRLERELEEKSSGPALSQTSSPLTNQVSELRAAAERADQLQREVFALRSEMDRKLKEKDFETAQARQHADRDAGERRKLESRLNGLEETQARTLEAKQKTIDALDASVATYRSKVDQLQKQLENQELQRLSDLNGFENKLRDRDRQDRAELDRVAQTQQRSLVEMREEFERKILEKDRQITDQRQIVDREAGERRRLSEVLSRLQETADRMVKEKDTALAAVEATLASFKAKAETLQRRVNDLEQLRRSDQDLQAARTRSAHGARARLEEAGHFASDLDHNLDGVEALLTNLRERMKRLKDTITTPAEAEPAASMPSAPLSSLVPEDREPEAAPAPTLSQTGFGFTSPPPPALEEIPSPEPAAVETPAEEPEPTYYGKVDAPTSLDLPAIRSSEPEAELEVEPLPSTDDEPAPADIAKTAPLPTADVEEAVPLISHPEEEVEPASPPPPKAKEAPSRPRFSWKRK
jgi:chromosome segregation ATPase